MLKMFTCIFLAVATFFNASAQNAREELKLEEDWLTAMDESDSSRFTAFELPSYEDLTSWKRVDVPHNWDQYGGYRRQVHGNIHGFAWYRKSFTYHNTQAGKRFYRVVEAVASYATIWLTGNKVGYHAGGRTPFTLYVS